MGRLQILGTMTPYIHEMLTNVTKDTSRVAEYRICLPWLKGLIWVEDMCCTIVKKMAKIRNATTAWKVFVFWFFLARLFPHLDWVRRDTIVWSMLMMKERGGKTLTTKMQLSVTKTIFQWLLSLHFCSKSSLLQINFQNSPILCFSSFFFLEA